MKTITVITFVCIFFQTMHAQNFTGEIKYTITSLSFSTNDTITYFFDKNFVLKKYPKEAVLRGGDPYGINVLSDNKIFMFNNQKKIWFEIPVNPNMLIRTSVPDFVGMETFLAYTCSVYEITQEMYNENIHTNDQNTIWVSEKFIFDFSKSFIFFDPVFSNGTGRIALRSEITGTTQGIGYSGTHDSTLTAISISPVLSEEYKMVLADFLKWYNR